MKEHIDRRSKRAGYQQSILPKFSKEESDYLKGSIDYWGLNNYGNRIVSGFTDDKTSLNWEANMEVILTGSHQVSTYIISLERNNSFNPFCVHM